MSHVCRLEPYFEPPSKAEDANSPVGPLQHHVAEPDFVEWENIDWAALSLGQDVSSPGFIHAGYGEEGSSSFENGNGGSSEHIFDFGQGHGFVWPAGQYPFPQRMRTPNQDYHHPQ